MHEVSQCIPPLKVSEPGNTDLKCSLIALNNHREFFTLSLMSSMSDDHVPEALVLAEHEDRVRDGAGVKCTYISDSASLERSPSHDDRVVETEALFY